MRHSLRCGVAALRRCGVHRMSTRERAESHEEWKRAELYRSILNRQALENWNLDGVWPLEIHQVAWTSGESGLGVAAFGHFLWPFQ